MLTARIVIIGGGLAGLYAAYLLEQRGMTDYVLLEARSHFGGRIAATPEGHDLGATWFWPELQTQLSGLIDTLQLPRFEQYASGDMVIERSRQAAPERMASYFSAPPSMRLAGGMGALTEALQAAIPAERTMTGQRVRRLQRMSGHIHVEVDDEQGNPVSYQAEHVLLALPPRLAAAIAYTPALPATLADTWSGTPTWMAPHAKYVAIYKHAFWRSQGLSGHARSAGGPLAEIHDASADDGPPALFGFLGVPAIKRQDVSAEVLLAHCRAQLVRLFGQEAGSPVAEYLKDWATDSCTATPADWQGRGEHPDAPAAQAGDGRWQGRITGIASEWSPHFPGYLAGAIDAAQRGVASLSKTMETTP